MILKLLVMLVILEFAFKIFLKFMDGAVDNVNFSYYVYVDTGLRLDQIVCLKLGSTV